MDRPTVGKLSSDLLSKVPDTVSPIEQMYENLTDYDRTLFQTVDYCKKIYPHDFFIVVLTKKEPLMQNVLRNYFLGRKTCPTPDYDQTVYHYKYSDEILEFLWVIPSRDTCQLFKHNALHINKSERDLLNFVIDFADGTLFRRCKKLNNERDDSPELKKE